MQRGTRGVAAWVRGVAASGAWGCSLRRGAAVQLAGHLEARGVIHPEHLDALARLVAQGLGLGLGIRVGVGVRVYGSELGFGVRLRLGVRVRV